MLDDARVAHLESGCALIVGTVAADGAPHASRSWGCSVESVDHVAKTAVLRLVLPADDPVLAANLGSTGRISITTADVRTLRSMQLKGRAGPILAATPADLAKVRQYTDDFFTDIVVTDGEPREMLDGWPPGNYIVSLVTVDELFDQTPGPSAGAVVARDGG